MCRGISAVLANHPLLTVCATADEAPLGRRWCEAMRPEFVVIDLDFPETDGLGLLRDCARIHPEGRILALGEREEWFSLQQILQAGASGYVSKRDADLEIRRGLERLLMQGGRYVGHRIWGLLLDHAAQGEPVPPPRDVDVLSGREKEVFSLMGEGMGASVAARRLGISVKTIETHCHRIKLKLGLATGETLRRKAAEWALAHATSACGLATVLLAV